MAKNIIEAARVHEFIRSWYGQMEDLIDDLKDAGFSVEDACREYVTGWDEKSESDVFFMIRLGGTEHTITVEGVEIEVMED